MGFLLGAFGKLAAGQRYRSLQARMMRIQSRLRRATRDAADMEKMINRQEKAALNSLTVQSNSALTIAKNGALASIFSQAGGQELMNKAQSNPLGMTQEETQKYNGMMSQVSQLQTNMSAVCETNTRLFRTIKRYAIRTIERRRRFTSIRKGFIGISIANSKNRLRSLSKDGTIRRKNACSKLHSRLILKDIDLTTGSRYPPRARLVFSDVPNHGG